MKNIIIKKWQKDKRRKISNEEKYDSLSSIKLNKVITLNCFIKQYN